jgi:hypothetical protein
MAVRSLSRRPRTLLIAALCTAVLIVLVVTSVAVASNSRQATTPIDRLGGPAKEVLTAPFVNGPWGVTTANSYSGPTVILVTGTGQASASEWSDAFYVFTDGAGNPVEPWRLTEGFNFTLWINGGPADVFVNPIPPYNPDHVYLFKIDAPGGPLTFGVGDVGTGDNSGEYTIGIRDLGRMRK